jgi:hypothetical protein
MLHRREVLFGIAAALSAGTAWGQTAPVGARRFAEALQMHTDRAGTSLLVMRYGVTLHESYAQGYGETTPSDIGEITRVLALLTAAGLGHQELMTLSEPVALSIGGWGAHPLKQLVTLRTLLDLTSGVALQGAGGDPPLAQIAVDAEPVAAPGERFIQDAAPYQVFAEVARRKMIAVGSDGDIQSFLDRRLLGPIGARITTQRAGDGLASLYSGATANARSLALVGELIRRAGIYRAAHIASSNVLREARIGSEVEPRFGCGVWLAGPPRRAGDPGPELSDARAPAPPDTIAATGANGQRLYVIPSMALVIVRQAAPVGPVPDWPDAAFLRAVMAQL